MRLSAHSCDKYAPGIRGFLLLCFLLEIFCAMHEEGIRVLKSGTLEEWRIDLGCVGVRLGPVVGAMREGKSDACLRSLLLAGFWLCGAVILASCFYSHAVFVKADCGHWIEKFDVPGGCVEFLRSRFNPFLLGCVCAYVNHTLSSHRIAGACTEENRVRAFLYICLCACLFV